MNMIPHFEIVSFDPSRDKVSIKINVLEDEYLNFIRSLPRRVYNHSSQTNEIPSSSLQEFYNRADEKEYRYTISDELSREIDDYFKRADFKLTLDARRGRIVIAPNRPNLKPLYQSGLTTWAMEYERYSVAISEAYNIPSIIPVYNPTVSFEYSPEVKEVLAREASRRANLFALSSATDAPEVADDISFSLRPFQKVAKKFALHLDGRAILAYDMGLGKTPIAISITEALQLAQKVLVICPATLKTNWRREIKKATGLDASVLSGASPSVLTIQAMMNPDIKYHIINYDILGRGTRDKESKQFVSDWARTINLMSFDMIIVDEAHYTKNMDSGRSKAVRDLKSRYMLPLTGTPVVNRPAELFPLLHMVDPVNFPSFESFCGQWLYNDGKSVRNENKFREMLAAYMIRRRKEDVIKDLPMIERFDRFIELSGAAESAYSKALEGIYVSLRNPDYQRDINNILVQLMRLKQIVADDTVQHTVELAREIYEETSKKTLIFSQFVSTCHDIHSRLGTESLCITGEDSDDSRYKKIDAFQSDPNIKYMVLSTKAGAEGITLTAAHYIIFNDLCWTPKDHRQAEARCYGRMNDLHSATAYYMQAEGTVTETIMAILRAKMDIIEKTVDGINKSAAEGQSIITEFLTKLKGGM
jgi:SWI/SNF-related matrix-associated actin-dependent regulator 1 of chromatin subfamily A